MKHLLIIIILSAFADAKAQQCDQFDKLLKKGDAYLKDLKPNYQEAINAYTAAILACSDRASEAQKRIGKMVDEINHLRIVAVEAENKAVEAQKNTATALALIEVEQAKTQAALEDTRKSQNETKEALAGVQKSQVETQIALQKAEKLINTFYSQIEY